MKLHNLKQTDEKLTKNTHN